MIENMQACVPELRRYASALLHDRHTADDLVHECLERALDRLHMRQQDCDIRPWLFAIMHELLVSRTWRVKLHAAVQTHNGEETGAPNDRVGAVNGVSERDLMRIVKDLPEEQRRVLLW